MSVTSPRLAPFPATVTPARGSATAASASGRAASRVDFDGARGLSALLLGAMVSALLVVADQLIETWADGHLLAAWVFLWLVSFAALALFGGAARRLSSHAVATWRGYAAQRAESRADEHLWAVASLDARVMRDLQVALSRRED